MRKRDLYRTAIVTPQMMRDFAPVRARVMAVVAAAPKTVTLEAALAQIKSFGLGLNKR